MISGIKISKTLLIPFIFFMYNLMCSQSSTIGDDRESIIKMGKVIRKAFAEGDINTISSYHHPEVIKAINFDTYLNGRKAVIKSLQGTLDTYELKFGESTRERILIKKETAILQSVFTLSGIPKKGGEPFVFKGRTIVVCVRYDQSPSGWAIMQEVIQPAN